VGTKSKPWWPTQSDEYKYLQFDYAHGQWNIQSKFGQNVSALSSAFVELAFIGAAVRELAKRNVIFKIQTLDGWATVGGIDSHGNGPTLLHALVAALNESEGA